MGLLGNVVKGLWENLPQTVEGCDREILQLEKSLIDHKRWGHENAAAGCKKRIAELKAQKKKLKAKK